MGWLIGAGIIVLGFMSGVVITAAGGNGLLQLLFWGIAAVIYVFLFVTTRRKREPRSVNETVIKKEMTVLEIPQNAHDAVEAFARLANMLWRDLEDMGLPGDPYFSRICISMEYIEGSARAKARFSVDFDRSVLNSIIRDHGYNLGEGFSFSDSTTLNYSSESITGLAEWFGHSAEEWKSMPTSSRDIYGAGVEATVTNNCPAAHVSSATSHDTGRNVIFKFD